MNGKRLIQSSLHTLVRFKLRSFFMSIGVALGVATLIAGSSVGGGAAQKISAQIEMWTIGTDGCTRQYARAKQHDQVFLHGFLLCRWVELILCLDTSQKSANRITQNFLIHFSPAWDVFK